MPRFLPRSMQDYALPRREPADFTHAATALLDDIGRKMSVDMARSEGRIPSPFSRSFVFYLNLYGKGIQAELRNGDDAPQLDHGRQLLQEEARRTFRGLLAVFALRKVLGLQIRQSVVPLSAGGRRLEQSLLTSLDSAPRGAEHWNPLRFYTVAASPHAPAETLAGLSPLTVLAPAARPPRRLPGVYWYDPGDGGGERPARWYDPTAAELGDDGAFRLTGPGTLRTVRRLLRAWLTAACASTAPAGALSAFGLAAGDGRLLHNELRRWLGELGGDLREPGLVETEAIPGDPRDGVSPAFLEYACQAPPGERYGELLGDLPWFGARLLVTREQLLDPRVRIYGRTFGSPALEEAVDRLSRFGDDLGADLGMDAFRIPVSYLFVDQLFASRLTLVTERGLSEGWKGLEIEGGHYLLPFHPEILNLIPPDELVAATRGERDRLSGEHYVVSLRFGGVEIPQRYAISGHDTHFVDAVTIPPEHLDIRLFPNFDLDSAGRTPGSSPLRDEDRTYYARVRVGPLWRFPIFPFRYDESGATVRTGLGERVLLGPSQDSGDAHAYHPGQVLVFTMKEKPSGFYVEDRGFCLVDLPVARGMPSTWKVGVDFGTSNTCVTCRTEGDAVPRILRFPVLTTTLLREPGYSAEFEGPGPTPANEGASALLDFFYRQQADENLSPNDYFPTQVVTRYEEPAPRSDWQWDFDGGLVYFKNASLASRSVWELLDVFPVPAGDASTLHHEKEFHVKRDIKWSEIRWLRVFMVHLRAQVLMTAARERGTVSEIVFSYPKAFSFTQKEAFLEVLHEVWNPGAAPGVVATVSESEAVRNYLVRQASEYVVFDVGGGTTDLIGFSVHQPIFQTSFKLAAGHLNRYVVESPHFRRVFLDAFADKVPGAPVPAEIRGEFQGTGGAAWRRESRARHSEALLDTVWLGLLELIESHDTNGRKVLEILGVLRRMEDDLGDPAVRAVRGFFLSLTLLFGGLSYFAGMLVRLASEGKFDGQSFDRRSVELVLTGNGAKLYTMLNHPDAPFAPVIQGMFLSGMAAADEAEPGRFSPDELARVGFAGLYRLDGRLAPKVTVALGLLQPPPAGAAGLDGPVPLANVLGEDGYSLDGAPAGVDGDLVAFYRAATPERLRGFTPPAAPPRQLRRCLEALNRLLPNGMNQGMPVIPRAGADWHRELMDRLYPLSERHIRTRVAGNAARLGKDLGNNLFSEAEVPAQEPLFIVELAALLDEIRLQYAGGPEEAS